MTNDPMAEIKATFFLECEELLETLLEGLELLSDGSATDDTIHAVFRSVHSIKGGAGAFGLDRLVHFAHRFENVLDLMRSGSLEVTADLMTLCFRATDLLSDLVRAGQTNKETDTKAEEDALQALSSYCTAPEEPEAVVAFEPMGLEMELGLEDPKVEEGSKGSTTVQFKPDMSMMMVGHEPLHSLRALQKLGAFDTVCHLDALPSLDNLGAEDTYFHWTLSVPGEVEKGEIDAVFEFVDGLCEIQILSQDLPEEPAPLQKVETPAEDPKSVPSVAQKPEDNIQETVSKPAPTIRVELDRIDRLVNLVGELVINQAMLAQSASHAALEANSPFQTGLDEFLQLTRDIQDSVMMIRAQPVKSLFQRMGRIVREASAATEKTVKLHTEGEGTEIDKTVLEKLVDPLTHMIRNAVDHGLESPDLREESGKNPEGSVMLSARHRSGRVIIEVRDDGAGLNRSKILERAKSRDLVSPDAELSESEIDALLFLPGFSTVDKVSDLSGRGVGMDVVKRSIHALGGRVSISSAPGKGTCFSISLPLTLAILDGMVVKVADQTLVMPLAAIVETLSLEANDIVSLAPNNRVIQLRGQVVPIFDLGAELGYRNENEPIDKGVTLLIHSDGGADYALIVDGILEQRQVVIKGLQDSYGHVPGIAAATILGDGQIALILDPLALRPSQKTPQITPNPQISELSA